MSNLSFINVSVWTPEQVANWMKGLDDVIQPYVEAFAEGGITGKKLLVLDHLDLDILGVRKLGHQELVLEAIDHLRQLQYSLDSETVQSIALKLCCQARSVKTEIQAILNETGHDNSGKLPLVVLSGVAFLMGHIKNLVSWVDRPPFDGSDEYTRKRNDMVKLGMDLISAIQGENSVFSNHQEIISLCTTVVERCENIIRGSKDSLTVQPAWLELAIIRKKPIEDLGMHIQSSYNGTHTIGGIKVESPADNCKKIGEGDEVIQVNYQTVIGWQLKKLVASLKENPKEVTLFLKRRPCHTDPFGTNHRKKNKLSAQPGTFPNRAHSRRSRKGRTALEELISTTPVETDNFSDSVKEAESENDALDDNDNVFRSGSESPGFQHLRTFEDAKQRRATVSGGSPTLKRPSIMISDSDTPRPKSYVLPLHSPTSGETYTFDLNCLELRSPVADLISPPTDSDSASKSGVAQTNKHSGIAIEGKSATTYSSPLTSVSSADSVFVGRTGDKSTTDSSGAGMDSSTDASFDHTEAKETIFEETEVTVAANPKSVPRVAVSVSECVDKPYKSTSIRDYRRTVSQPGHPNTASYRRPTEPALAPIADTSSVQQPVDANSPTHVSTHTVTLTATPTQEPIPADVNNPSPNRSMSMQESSPAQPYGSMGAVPKEITRLSPGRGDLPRSRKASEQAAKKKAVAGGCDQENTPTLLKVSRIDSIMRAQMSQQERRQRGERSSPSPEHSPTLSTQQDERPMSVLSTYSTYSVNIVGGVPHVSRSNHLPKKNTNMTQSNQSLLRKGASGRQRRRLFGGNRRISCKDLGSGDCQGWLYKKRDGSGIGSKWTKLWFVLKAKDIYFYKTPEDERAKGIIHLPGFEIKPAPEVKSKKYAFKAEHSGTTFYFASDRQDDMAKWMTKMGLSSIQYEARADESMAAFVKHDSRLPEIIENPHACYHSESEDDDDAGPSTPGTMSSGHSMEGRCHSPGPSTSGTMSSGHSMEDVHDAASDDNLEKVFENIQRTNADPFGNQNRREKRISHLPQQQTRLPNPAEIERYRKLSSLQRTLKDRERDLQAIDDVLNGDLSASSLEHFRKEQPALNGSLEMSRDNTSQSSPSQSEDETGAAHS